MVSVSTTVEGYLKLFEVGAYTHISVDTKFVFKSMFKPFFNHLNTRNVKITQVSKQKVFLITSQVVLNNYVFICLKCL